MGKKTGIDLSNEGAGLLASPLWKQRRFKQKWYQGETVITGIGQGYTLTTPLQLAYATATLANHGVAMRPHLVQKIQNPMTGEVRTITPFIQDKLDLNHKDSELVQEGMTAVTLPGGTASNVGQNAGYSIAAKTGTAQVIGIKQNEKYRPAAIEKQHRDHALFIAYAPVDNPQIALAIVVENGGHGGSTAGPIARKIMDYHLLKIVSDASSDETESQE